MKKSERVSLQQQKKKEQLAKLKKNSVNALPRLSFGNKKRVYLDCVIASTAICESNDPKFEFSKFSEMCLQDILVKYIKTAVPVYHGFDERFLLGQAMVEGVEVKANVTLLKAKLTIIAPVEYINKMLKGLVPSVGYSIATDGYSIGKTRKGSDARIENKIQLLSVGMIPKNMSVDDNLKICGVLKDEEVEKRLSED